MIPSVEKCNKFLCIVYPATLSNSLMKTSSFLLTSLGFSIYIILSSAYKSSFTFFQFEFHLFLFLIGLLCILQYHIE